MVKFMQLSDLHLDSPFDALPPDKAKKRREGQRELLLRAAEKAAEIKAGVVLLPGDLLDSGRCGLESAAMLTEALRAMPGEVFIAPGNHDYYSPRSPYATLELPENVHIFRSASPRGLSFPDKGFTVWGAAFEGPNAPALLRGFRAPDRGLLNIMALHGDVSSPKSPYCPVAEEDIAASGLDYLALGHIHAYSGLKRAGDTFYAYAGCPEGRGFDECGEKGIITGEIGASACEIEFVPLAGYKYFETQADLSRSTDALRAALRALPEDCGRQLHRVTLTGEFSGEIDPEAIAAALSKKCFSASVRDRTRLKKDIWDRAEEDSLRGGFLRRMREKFDSAQSDGQRETVVLAVRYGLAAIDDGEEYRT